MSSLPTKRQLMVFFGVAACAQGLNGLLTHPLTYYLKSLGLGADAVNQALALAAVPWIVKPVYGLVTDFVPLFGYRRKSYLLLTLATAALGYLWLTQAATPSLIIGLLCAVTLGVAATDVVVDALMVEHGQRTGLVQTFQGQQWIWLNVSAVAAALIGGWLTHSLAADSALHGAALLIAFAPIAVGLATVCVLKEDYRPSRLEHVRTTGKALRSALALPAFWSVAGFMILWNATPRFTTPLYYHMTDNLMFDQYFVGQLHALGAIGSAIGAIGYKHWLADRSQSSALLSFSIVLTGMVTLAHMLLVDARTALVLYFVGGVISTISLLTVFSLAASVCHRSVAAFSFATLMALYSAGGQFGSIVGGHLYEGTFDHEIGPLIRLASAITIATLLWVPFLPYGKVASDQVAKTAEPDADRERRGEAGGMEERRPHIPLTSCST
jgi:MFS-type transporter involved in bile tolerance (Atg22 family)